MALQLRFLPLPLQSHVLCRRHSSTSFLTHHPPPLRLRLRLGSRRRASGREDTVELTPAAEENATPEELNYISQIKRVLELLRENRDMLFEEVRLTIMIEDPREAERKRLLGIDDDDVTRDDLVAALDDVNEGRVPQNGVALKLLAEEMLQWPNLEVEAPKARRSNSSYAKITDTGIDPKDAAKKLNVDWDAAAEVESEDGGSEPEVPPVVGYGALYLVTALPVLIGISVVLILFYNSLQ